MNPINSAVRKIHNLLSSGAVTVTGPNQPRILKQKVGSTIVSTSTTNNNQQNNSGNMVVGRCYVCDENTSGTQNQTLTEMQTTHTSTKFPNKIGQLVGDAFMVIVSVEDVVCQRCTNLINYLDRLENDVERVRNNILNLLHKKYGLNDDGATTTTTSNATSASSPPIKMQKLNSGNAAVSRVTAANEDNLSEVNRTRKSVGGNALLATDTIGKQSPPVSAVQQIKLSTTPQQQPKKTTTKVYKCLSCDFKTTDLKQFNPHYETCKQQNFQCKICKKIFANLAAMKHHMAKDHGTTAPAAASTGGATEHACSICHLNFTSDLALKKHMELNHSSSVMNTTITSSPAETTASQHSTPLYTCNHCQFKSTDKPLFDEHMRKHIGGKPKPFKCRLCSMRFETREQATVHAKQHQPNYFKCGTCSMSFPKRELLVKHFEVHQQQQPQQQQQQTQKQPATVVQQQVQIVQQQPQQQPAAPQMMTTQKLLQDTIDEALSESAGEGGVGDTTKSIRFFSCHICSLTFIQENYYNQHMETHKREKKGSTLSVSSAGTTVSAATTTQAMTSTSQSTHNQSLIRDVGKQRHEAANVLISGGNVQQHAGGVRGSSSLTNNTGATISEADIESIFEKMHSDKSDNDAAGTVATNTTTRGTHASDNSAATAAGDNLVITSQESSGGGITFNITIPQPESAEQHNEDTKSSVDRNAATTPVSVSIDMPVLDHADDTVSGTQRRIQNKNSSRASTTASHSNAGGASQKSADDNSNLSSTPPTSSGPVSMPSLDDDNEAQQQAAADQQQSQEHQSQEKQHIESQEQQQQQQADGASTPHNPEEEDEHQEQNEHDEAMQQQHEHEQQQLAAAGDQVQSMDLDDMQAGVEGGQIKFILNENGQLLQLDNHIITDADGNQILVQGSDSEQIQQLLQSVGVLQSGDGLDGETLQMIGDNNGQMVIVQGEQGETQLIDASLLNADGHIVIQQSHDGDLSEGGAHVIGEDGTRIPVSVSYTADGQPIVQVQQQHQHQGADESGENVDKDNVGDVIATTTSTGETTSVTATQSLAQSSGGGFFALEDLMQQPDAAAKDD